MLSINFIKENLDQVKQAAKHKKVEIDIDEILNLSDKRGKLKSNLDQLRRERNENAAKLKGTNEKPSQDIIELGRNLKTQIQEQEKEYVKLDEKYWELMYLVPNVTSEKMPIGKDENENVVVRKVGTPRQFDFEIKDHVDLGESLDLIELEKARQISGSRFYYLKNEAVLMQFAIINLVMQTLTNRELIGKLAKKVGNPFDVPFVPIIPPVMMKPEIMQKMGRLDPIEDRYQTKLDGLMLIGSAEHTLGPLLMNETVNEKDLPLRYIGYSTAFRRESGSHGQDVRGILRVHQFDKLEMETFVPKEYGQLEQDLIVEIQEYLVQQLEIPYQLIQICTGDTGKPDFNQYDINCWVPSQNKYRETHTADYMTDYQSRRLKIRYIGTDGEKHFAYMNDATAFAIGRILLVIMENNQQKDGSVVIPEVLRDYVGKEIIKPQLKKV